MQNILQIRIIFREEETQKAGEKEEEGDEEAGEEVAKRAEEKEPKAEAPFLLLLEQFLRR
jgi:hypothetical protein